jgi:acetolactate synthase small subunit
MAKALILAALIALSACTTTRGGFCQIAKPIRPENVDVLTDAEVTQILGHNEKGRALCGWKPT